jgi:hypothetical protein
MRPFNLLVYAFGLAFFMYILQGMNAPAWLLQATQTGVYVAAGLYLHAKILLR